MYINPVIAGILGTLFVETLILIVGSLLVYFDSKGEKDGKDNDNPSNVTYFNQNS